MTTTSKPTSRRIKYSPDAEAFVFAALHLAQKGRGGALTQADDVDEVSHHVTGAELLEAIRLMGLERFGLLARFVFARWGITTTDDFGRVVYSLIEEGRMHKTQQDRLSDFFDVYRFEVAFDREYAIDTRAAFSR